MPNLKLKKAPTYDRKKSQKLPITKTVTVFTDDGAVEGLREAEKTLQAALTRRDSLQATLDRTEASGATVDGLLALNARVGVAQEEVDAAEAAVQAALDEIMENHAVSFTLRSKGRKVYDRLILEHPPTEAQIKDHADEGLGECPYNADTFPPALLQAVCIEPVLELWEWKAFFDWDSLTDEELELAAQEVLESAGVIDRAKVIESLRETQPEWNTSELVELTQAAIEVSTHRRVVNLGKAYG